MANPSITSYPQQTINTFVSKWNASSLPILYTITNDKFPTGETVTNYYTEVNIYVNGVLVGTINQIPDSNNETIVDIRKYVQTALLFSISDTLRDTNATAEFYIIGSEHYVDVYDNAKSLSITGGGASNVHYASLSSLQFGATYGGNMYDYVLDQNKLDLAKWMTFFERGSLVDTTDFLLSIIVNIPGFDIEVVQYDTNDNVLDTTVVAIANEGIGLYRLSFSGVSFSSDTTYITVQALVTSYGTAVSEIFYLDVDLSCVDSLSAPSAFTFSNPTISTLDAAITSNSGGNETGFQFEISTSPTFATITQTKTTASGVTTTTFTGLDDATLYYGQAKALGESVDSAYSDSDSATTAYDFGESAVFDGVNDGQSGYTATNIPMPSVYSMSVWWRRSVLRTVDSGINEIPINIGGTSFSTRILHGIDFTTTEPDPANRPVIGLTAMGTVTPTVQDGTFLIDDYNLHNYIFVYNESTKTVKAYMDGVLRLTSTFTGAFAADIRGVIVSNITDSQQLKLIALAELRMANVEMTADDVSDEWNSGYGGGWIENNVTDANHTFLWRLNQVTGNSLTDDSPNAVNLTISNVADTGYGTQLTVSSESGTPNVGDLVTGGTSGATGLVVSHSATDLEIEQVKGLFESAETVTSTGYSATVDSVLTRFWDKA